MRFTLTLLLTLLLFTANVVAVSFDHCDDPFCANSSSMIQKKDETGKKNVGGMMHCAAGCHQVVAMPANTIMASRMVVQEPAFWSNRLIHESVILESLIEPPSLA